MTAMNKYGKFGKSPTDMTSIQMDHIKRQVVESISDIISHIQRSLDYLEIIFKFELENC